MTAAGGAERDGGGRAVGRTRPVFRMPETERWLAVSRHRGHLVELVADPRRGADGGALRRSIVGRLVVVASVMSGSAGAVAVVEPPEGTPVAIPLAIVVTVRRA